VSFTVVPLHNLDLPEGSRIPFGPKYTIQDIPEWVKKDEATLKDLARHDDVDLRVLENWEVSNIAPICAVVANNQFTQRERES
jgi:hypothetical protein